MVPGGGLSTSRIAVSGRASATGKGKGREGESKDWKSGNVYWGLFYGAWGRSEGLPRLLQLGEPGPRGGVGEGKSKYLRYLEDKFRDLHALRPGASAD